MATIIEAERQAFRPPTTAEELLRLPDDMHGEIVNGVFVAMSAPGGIHGFVASRIDRILGAFVDAHGLGGVFGAETAFRLRRDPDTVRCPDCAFVAAARLAAALTRGVVEGAPDLAVEVLSPSNTWAEMERKLAEYFRHGARQVWIVDPDSRSVAAHVAGGLPQFLEGDAVLGGGELLPGFATPVSAFFAGLPPAAASAAPAPGPAEATPDAGR